MVPPGEDKDAWVSVPARFPSRQVGMHQARGGPTGCVCEQGRGCLADMSVRNTRREVSEPWTSQSLSIPLSSEPLAPGRAGRDSQSSGPCHSRSLPGLRSDLPEHLASR